MVSEPDEVGRPVGELFASWNLAAMEATRLLRGRMEVAEVGVEGAISVEVGVEGGRMVDGDGGTYVFCERMDLLGSLVVVKDDWISMGLSSLTGSIEPVRNFEASGLGLSASRSLISRLPSLCSA